MPIGMPIGRTPISVPIGRTPISMAISLPVRVPIGRTTAKLAGSIGLVGYVDGRVAPEEPYRLQAEPRRLHRHDWEVFRPHYVGQAETVP